jgi:hypothetical protein
VHKSGSFGKIKNYQNLHLNFNAKTYMTGKKNIPQNGLPKLKCKPKKKQFYPPESYTELKFKEKQFAANYFTV